MCACHGEHANVRGRLLGVASFSPPHGLQGWPWVVNHGCRVPFPPESFHWLKMSNFEGKKEKLFKFLFELSAQASASNSWGYLSVTERGSMPPLSEEERKLIFVGDQQEGASAEKPWPEESRTLKVLQAQQQPVLNWFLVALLMCCPGSWGHSVWCHGQY